MVKNWFYTSLINLGVPRSQCYFKTDGGDNYGITINNGNSKTYSVGNGSSVKTHKYVYAIYSSLFL